MAFENLKPHRELIEKAKGEGKSLAEIAELLAGRNVATTPGTLSRFLKDIGSPYRPRELTRDEHARVDQTVLLTEIFAEVQGAKEESRAVIERLAGKVAMMSATIEELEKSLHRATPEARVIRKVWLRAFLVSLALTGSAATAAVARALGWM